jgi:predicted esterase
MIGIRKLLTLAIFSLSVTEIGCGAAESTPEHLLYSVSLPKNYDSKKEYELVVALHGSGDPPKHFVQALRSLMPERDCILIAPDSEDVNSWTNNDLASVVETIESARKKYRIAKNRTVLLGFSAGAGIGFFFIAERPALADAFCAFAHHVDNDLTDDALSAAKQIPVFYSVGTRDKYWKASSQTASRLKTLGFRLNYEAPDGVGHELKQDQLERMFKWIDSLRKPEDSGTASSASITIGPRK